MVSSISFIFCFSHINYFKDILHSKIILSQKKDSFQFIFSYEYKNCDSYFIPFLISFSSIPCFSSFPSRFMPPVVG